MRQAPRGLARSSRTVPDPDEMSDVLGSITSTLGALNQSLTQIGVWHRQHADRAVHDDGDQAAGAADAEAVTAQLHRAVVALDVAATEVMAVHSANGRIAWQPTGGPCEQALHDRSAALDAASALRALGQGETGTGAHLI